MAVPAPAASARAPRARQARLRLLYVIDSLVPGGAERSLAAIGPHLRTLGVDVTVAYLEDRPGLQAELSAGGAEVVSLAGARGRAGNIQRVTRFVREKRPQLIHTTLFEADVAGRTSSLITGVPVVSTFAAAMYDHEHMTDPSLNEWRVQAARLVDMCTARRVRRFHAVSAHVADIMSARLHVARDRIEVIHRGRDAGALGCRTHARRTAARRGLGLNASDKVVFAAARHEHKKGLDVLLQAFPRILEKVPSARLVVAGRDGLQTPLLHELAGSLDIAGRMIWLGDRDDVPDLMTASDVFVLPSVSEGFPGILLEAMALEAPIVASDLPAAREILGDAGTGRLVTPRSPDLLCAAVVATLADTAGAAASARAALRRFKEHFSIQSVAGKMLAFYDRALNER